MSEAGTEGRLVGAALRVMPASFRAEYGDEMRLLARDTVREAEVEGRASIRSVRARMTVDLLVSAVREHARNESVVHLNAPGLGAGIAIAIGLPLLVASYSSYGFWSLVAETGAVAGFDSASVAVHPSIVVVGAALMAIGLVALTRRISAASGRNRIALLVGSWASSILIGLGGAAMYGYALPTNASWHAFFDVLGGVLIGPGFLALLAVLIATGVAATRVRALGSLSFAPFAVAGSLIMLMGVALFGFVSGTPMEVFLRGPAMAVVVWSVPASSLVLGAGLALTPHPARRQRGVAPSSA